MLFVDRHRDFDAPTGWHDASFEDRERLEWFPVTSSCLDTVGGIVSAIDQLKFDQDPVRDWPRSVLAFTAPFVGVAVTKPADFWSLPPLEIERDGGRDKRDDCGKPGRCYCAVHTDRLIRKARRDWYSRRA